MATKQATERDLEKDEREDDEDEDRDSDAGSDKSADAREPEVSASSSGVDVGRASRLRNVWTITRREVRSYFDSLIAYVVVGLSMLGVGIWTFLLNDRAFWTADRASMSRMFEAMPWLICGLVIPLITMRALSEEKRSGTLELLITLPVRDSEVILGKYFAALLMVLILFVSSLLYPFAMFIWPWHLGALDWGPVFAAYFGLFLMACAGVSVGMLFSGLTESQIISFFLSSFVLLLLMAMGSAVDSLQGWMGDVLAFISFQSRFAPFGRGVIDTRAVVYFLSIAIICLLVAFRSLESRKWK